MSQLSLSPSLSLSLSLCMRNIIKREKKKLLIFIQAFTSLYCFFLKALSLLILFDVLIRERIEKRDIFSQNCINDAK